MEKPKVRKDLDIMPEHLKGAEQDIIDIWRQYVRLRKEIHEHPRRFKEIKHPDNEEDTIWVDLIQARPLIVKKIRHLPKRDQNPILELASWFQSRKSKMGALARQFNENRFSYKKTGHKEMAPYVPYIIELFGQFKTNEEVCKELYTKYGYTVSGNKVSAVKLANKDEITRKQNEWAATYSDMDVAKKRGRLERLAYLLKTNTDEYNRDKRYGIERSREIRAIIEQIRKEVEGDRVVLDINGQVDITATLNINLSIQNLASKVSVNSFIIALVAAKRGLDPMVIQNQLINSYYRNFTGFKRLNAGDFKPQYPSNLINTYDWGAIAKVHEEDEKEPEVQEAEIVEDTDKQLDLKSKLLTLVQNSRVELKNGIRS